MTKNNYLSILVHAAVISTHIACNSEANTKVQKKINYAEMSNDLQNVKDDTLSDKSNLFDKDEIDPFKDSIDDILEDLQKRMLQDSAQIMKLGINDSGVLTTSLPLDASDFIAHKDTFSNDIRKINTTEIKALKFNLEQFVKADSLKKHQQVYNCKQKDCRLWANIDKSKQRLYLYIDGNIVDTFKVSTGDSKHETPQFDIRPSGPQFKKYTSKKFPGGNYNGLGNMPYVVFIKGGFAIHGTTTGNIPRLGIKASHGCIRLHPDNAKIFFELVKSIGLENTWITIQN